MAIRWTLFLLKTGIRGTELFFLRSNTGASLKLFALFSGVLFHVKLTTYWFHCSAFHIFFLFEKPWPLLRLQNSLLITVNQICSHSNENRLVTLCPQN